MDISDKIKSVVLAIKPNDNVVFPANIKGFVEPVSLQGIRSALSALKIAPFRK